ncbi:hypothetical protein TREES_T100000696 [Tupaia chinensis]|uniref:Uncharacterized protein n=1 Tax=Tupaia chinensis TaxID=246437 RepID=L9KKQ5_TUPCH|nr:hypothetical protein TREES_T100000696 [Tupaia chinensis]
MLISSKFRTGDLESPSGLGIPGDLRAAEGHGLVDGVAEPAAVVHHEDQEALWGDASGLAHGPQQPSVNNPGNEPLDFDSKTRKGLKQETQDKAASRPTSLWLRRPGVQALGISSGSQGTLKPPETSLAHGHSIPGGCHVQTKMIALFESSKLSGPLGGFVAAGLDTTVGCEKPLALEEAVVGAWLRGEKAVLYPRRHSKWGMLVLLDHTTRQAFSGEKKKTPNERIKTPHLHLIFSLKSNGKSHLSP